VSDRELAEIALEYMAAITGLRGFLAEAADENARLREALCTRLNEAVVLHKTIAEFRAGNARLRKVLEQTLPFLAARNDYSAEDVRIHHAVLDALSEGSSADG